MNTPLDPKEYASQIGIQMRKGLLVYCVLLICSRGNVYSSDVIKKLQETSLVVVEGTIYPLLSRLQNDGLLKHSWQESSQGPPRKYYRISPLGQKILTLLEATNRQLQATINRIEKG